MILYSELNVYWFIFGYNNVEWDDKFEGKNHNSRGKISKLSLKLESILEAKSILLEHPNMLKSILHY